MTRRHFVADLHLEAGRDSALAQAVDYFHRIAGDDTLFVLGDLFEFWVGDDQPLDALQPVVDALKAVSSAGTDVRLMHGNRDFLLGSAFADRIGATLVRDDYRLIDLDGVRTAVLHGDTLCTADEPYQALRREVRSDTWQQRFLARSLDERLAFAGDARDRSDVSTARKDDRLTDVAFDAVVALVRATGARLLIHGHTHRPAEHWLRIDGRWVRRLTLGDWHAEGGIVATSDAGRCRLAPSAGDSGIGIG